MFSNFQLPSLSGQSSMAGRFSFLFSLKSNCEAVQGACEILGLDPLYIANEGRFIAFVPEAEADAALEILREISPLHSDYAAQRIGGVQNYATPTLFGLAQGCVKLHHAIGGTRILDYLSGEQLPRIC